MRRPAFQPSEQGRADARMTPMIDVTFQLLIYFLCTQTFQLGEEVLPTNLPPLGQPVAKPSETLRDLEMVKIELAQEGNRLRVLLAGRPIDGIVELRQRLRELAAQAVDLPVILDIQPDVEVGHVIAVYDVCLAAGFEHINFAAQAG